MTQMVLGAIFVALCCAFAEWMGWPVWVGIILALLITQQSRA